jgi:hypothetical protein
LIEATRRLAERQYRHWACVDENVSDGGWLFVEALDEAGYRDGRCGRGEGADARTITMVGGLFGFLSANYLDGRASPPR